MQMEPTEMADQPINFLQGPNGKYKLNHHCGQGNSVVWQAVTITDIVDETGKVIIPIESRVAIKVTTTTNKNIALSIQREAIVL